VREGPMSEGIVLAIHIADKARAEMKGVDQTLAVPGKGLEGDRYFDRQGTFFNDLARKSVPDKEVTLIEQEALDALAREYNIELHPYESRRNVLTSGVALNHLVGREFMVGKAKLRGLRLCEPCKHLEAMTKRNLKGLTHRGGLRAQVLEKGEITVGDAVRVLDTPSKQHSKEFMDILEALGCEGGGKQ
jgi:MOSC domain-containing protein YiiM